MTDATAVQRRVEASVEPLGMAPLVSDSAPMACVSGSPTIEPTAATLLPTTAPTEDRPSPVQRRVMNNPTAPKIQLPEPVREFAGELAASSTTLQRRIEAGPGPMDVGPMDVAPLVSESTPLASTTADAAVQRVVDAPPQADPDPVQPPFTRPTATVQTQASQTGDEPPANGRVAPAVVGLVGERPIEPIVSGYPDYTGHVAAVDSAAIPAASATEWTSWPAIQRRVASVGIPGVAAVQPAVQRSMGAGTTPAGSWPSALAVSRSSPNVAGHVSPAQAVQFAAAEPIAVQAIPAEPTTQLVVQRAGDAGEPAAATSPTTATGPAGATTPAPPAGSTPPTEVDTLVRRLYDPIVRRLKAELQLDRERAGHSLDLRH